MQASPFLLASAATLLATGALRAQFNEPFDSQATANVTVQAEPDTAVMFVDYSNMTIGSTSFSIPEAPRRLPGSAPTRGVLIQANLTSSAAAAVNILAGATPISFTGRLRMSFDAWINVPVPLPGGSTEQLLWGIYTDGTGTLECRHNQVTGRGIYGWLAGENGYASEDAVLCENVVQLATLGDQVPGQGVFFNEAFDQPVGSSANAPGNQWVRVDIDFLDPGVRVLFNGVEFFNLGLFSQTTTFAMLGYEDPFSSLGTNPDAQWGLFDNFRVIQPAGCAAFPTAAIQGTATAGQILNGAAEPVIGGPMTIRLRGGPPSGLTIAAAGFPSPTTLPIPVGSCTLGVELLGALLSVIGTTDPLGNQQLTIEVPPNPLFCGTSLGFQWFWFDNSACGIAHTEGLALTIGS